MASSEHKVDISWDRRPSGTVAHVVFDTSRKRNRPYEFTIGEGRVIKGWDLGVPGMKVGGKRRLTIPAKLAYGSRKKGKIPPNSQLTFTIELVAAYPPLPDGKGEEAFASAPLEKRELEGGNGVVANVLLTRSKGANSRVD